MTTHRVAKNLGIRARARFRARTSKKFLAWHQGSYTIAAKDSQSSNEHITERHFSPTELGKIWGLSADTIRTLFESEPGVMIVGNGSKSKRRYRTFRIPERVAIRVHTRLSVN